MGLSEHVEEELLVEAGEHSIGGGGQELVGEVHEHAVIAGGVLGEGGLELGRHEGRIAGRPEQVVEALLGKDGSGVSPEELDRIAELVERAKREGKRPGRRTVGDGGR